jgi:hypothetical protein
MFVTPKFGFNVPWFLFDIYNLQLITSPVIPSDIKDTKQIILSETPIPGLNYAPINPAGGGNRKISFTLPLIKRNNSVGNVLLLQQFYMLRNQAVGLVDIFKGSGQFIPTPKVLYFWGTGSVPLVYFVSKCDATHKQGWVNQFGQPQYSEIEMELILDESDPLYVVEQIYQKISAYTGSILNAYSVVAEQVFGEKPY